MRREREHVLAPLGERRRAAIDVVGEVAEGRALGSRVARGRDHARAQRERVPSPSRWKRPSASAFASASRTDRCERVDRVEQQRAARGARERAVVGLRKRSDSVGSAQPNSSRPSSASGTRQRRRSPRTAARAAAPGVDRARELIACRSRRGRRSGPAAPSARARSPARRSSWVARPAPTMRSLRRRPIDRSIGERRARQIHLVARTIPEAHGRVHMARLSPA